MTLNDALTELLDCWETNRDSEDEHDQEVHKCVSKHLTALENTLPVRQRRAELLQALGSALKQDGELIPNVVDELLSDAAMTEAAKEEASDAIVAYLRNNGW